MKYFRFLIICSSFLCLRALAIEYNELEVYGYQTTLENELELENATSFSNDDQQGIGNRKVRSTFEFSYGVSNRWEVTAYLDYARPPDEKFDYTGFRAHARTRFFEKGELPVDIGAYFEVGLPKDADNHDLTFEFKPIIEKDFYRWTLSLNPQLEFEHQNDVIEIPSSTRNKTWRTLYGLSTKLAYRFDESFVPHLDLLQGFTDQDAMLLPSFDWLIVDHLLLTLGVGFGLNENTERRLVNARLEYEIYF